MKKRTFRSITGGGGHIPIVGQKPHKRPGAIALTGVRLTEALARQLPPFLDEAKPKTCTCPPEKLTVHLNTAPDGTLSVILGHEQECPSVERVPRLAPTIGEQLEAAAKEVPEGETREIIVPLEISDEQPAESGA